MQNWQPNGQAPSAQGHNNIWSGSYAFPDGTNQFDAAQNWSHQIPNQNAYSHLTTTRGNGTEGNLYASPHQGHAAVANEHNGMTTLNHGNFHSGHSQFSLDPSFGAAGQEDPLAGLDDFPQDMYGQPSKPDFANNIDNLDHSQPPSFSHQQFQYNGQANQLFNGDVPQYNDAQLLPQHGHQTPAQLQQRFEPVPQSYSPAPQGYVPSPQQHQAQPERVFSQSPHPFQAQHAHQQANQAFSNPTPPPFQQNQVPPYQQHKFVPQQVSYSQPGAASSFQPVAAKQMPDLEPKPQHTPQASNLPQPVRPTQATSTSTWPGQQQPQQQPQLQPQPQPQPQPQHQPLAAAPASQPGTPTIDPALQPDQLPVKKRKRVIKKDSEMEQSDSTDESAVKKAEDGETLIFPISTEEELAAVAQFQKRSAAAKKQFPAIPGASYLVSSGTVKMPAPKSYDRLAPLVALPSTSGRRILPEIRPDLPCEIQGRFTDRYRPSSNFVGKPDDREAEAKPLIEQYQREMKSLGNRRPKYADYPFTFQEQLKADEAAKSKAQRKARKEEEEERKKPIRPDVRPSDPAEGAAWDVLDIVYIDPSATRTNTLIAGAVQAFGEFLIKIRSELNRAKQEYDQASKEQSSSALAEWAPKLELRREVYIKVCEAAAKHGDEAVLENLGGHQKGILSLVNTLIGCMKSGDYNGTLPKALLRLLSKVCMSKKVVAGVNFETVRKRLMDKGDDEVKDLVRTIASRVKKESDPSDDVDVKKATSTAPASKATRPVSKAVDGSPAKRARDDDSDSRTAKKVAVESTSGAAGNKLSAKPAAGSLQSKLGATKPRPASSTTLAGKIRPPKPIAREPTKTDTSSKPAAPSTTSTPMDIDKKPTPAVSKPEPKVSAPKPAATSGSSLSSIASLLDSINTPKPDGPSNQAKDSSKKDTTESPEEKVKRLRKEARRKLRVTWRPESELVQVRIFHKEAAEDEDNMTKDAADDRSEGMMLKQRANFNEDEDDEDDLPYRPWIEPTLADLSGIPKDFREKSYFTRGGDLTFHTDEQKAMEKREKNELMVIYTDASDIPPTPKSPALEAATLSSEAKVGHLPQGEPKYDEVHKRWKETQQFGWEAAAYYARKRLDSKDDPATKLNSILGNLQPVAPAVTPEPYNMTPPNENAQPIIPSAAEMQPVPTIPFDDKVYSILISDKVKNWRDPNPFNSAAPQTPRRHDYPDPTVQEAADRVEEIAEELKGLPYPATTPPAWLANDQERVREWWAGFQKDLAAKAKSGAEDQAQAAAEAQLKAQQGPLRIETQTETPAQPQTQTQEQQDAWAAYYQQQQYAQYMALIQQMQAGQPQQPAQPTPAPAPAPAAPLLDGGNAQLQALLAQMGQQQPAQPQGNAYGLNPQDTGYQQLMMLAQLQQQQQPDVPQQPDVEPPSSNQDQPSYKPLQLKRQLVDYSDRDTRDEFDHHGGRERDRDRGREGRGGKQGKNRKGNAPGGATLPPHRPVNRALIGTKPCSFWQQGKCARGDKCTFRHDN
ncbi:hypothetical protein CCHL11_07464 [Colletotrichum chlorophyti]|uniref:C3H1-type domain-containing protein n=1 Tax=Colletotrichum chlorophyti TaxID=708187 RepID=A0A1Q8RZJ1_9PEZI|nr:hypothetical protein CCHL11_07464 [Colletotrichum chlorophyti]